MLQKKMGARKVVVQVVKSGFERRMAEEEMELQR